ncbi:MAG: hypothetical protein QXM68_03565 [Candidatus Aenigmatarchaeota archaeon]|nr:hypothetical protein [Candidatus Aenigmarchaeota archaeon]
MKKDLINQLREEFEHGKTVRKLSADYIQFLKDEVERKSFYEKFCVFCSSIIKINLDDEKSKELQQKLDFSNLKINASDVYSAFVVTLFFTALIFVSSFIALLTIYPINQIIKYVAFITIIGVSVSYYVLIYPNIYAKKTRVDASSEIVQAILYISIGLKNVPNLESAVAFAAFNLDGPLGKDLRKLLWDVYTGKYSRIEDGLDDFSRKWKFENREFSQAIDLLKTSVTEIYDRDKVIERAINLILQSNMERMNQYARDLKNPITIINALGVLLPVITLMIFPILGLIMPTLVSPYTLLFMYNIALPLVVYFLMKNVLEKRPYGFHSIDITGHPEANNFGYISLNFSKRKIQIPLLPFCIGIFLLISFPAIIGILNATIETPLFTRTLYGLQIFWGIIISLIIFTLMSTSKNRRIKKDLEEIESEFSEAIFMLGSTLRAGQPFESSLKSTSQRLKDQKIYSFFEKIIYKMNNFGMSLKDAVFHKDQGVIKEYPSKTIKNTMKIVVESTSKGLGPTASVLTAISQYMKNVHDVDEHLKQLLEDVTSSMGIMSSLLVPLAAGVVVGLSGIIMKILIFVSGLFAQLPTDSTEIPILNIKPESIMPIEMMIVVVGFYMIELIISLNIFKVKIDKGNDIFEIGYSIGTNLISAALIFTFAILIITFGLGALIPLSV